MAATPRNRAPRTNPTLAIRRAERAVATAATREEPTIPARPDDPPIFRQVWNELFGLPGA